jgi:pilus assembly protein CpaF
VTGPFGPPGRPPAHDPAGRPPAYDAGPLDPLLADPDVTDVLVNAPDEVWVERTGDLERAGTTAFADEESVRRLAVRLASVAGRRLDAAAPFVDAALPDGVRLHAVLHPVALGGTSICLRRPRSQPFTLAGLVHAGGLAPGMAAMLGAVVEARLATVVTGGTGAGKTTLLAALVGMTPERERVVLVEDTAELVVRRLGVVRMEARPANVEGAGAITLRDLVRQALRMRPDRLVVGEVRGAEVVDLLVALNTGHSGGLSTVHANSARELPSRMEALATLAGVDRPALHSLLGAGVDVAVHLCRGPDGIRRVSEVAVACAGRDGLVRIVPALTDPDARAAAGRPALATAPAPATLPPPGGTTIAGCTPGDGHPMLGRLLSEHGVRVPPIADPGLPLGSAGGPGAGSGGGPPRW